ncbi:cyclic nucleotide-binding and patatin-like phospholipase domain-containing protein [Chitinimonas sp. BJB300]|uniref:cyclic nucleotide-binding and patatin-like phospholipase domain-containing protein n=1 Tax=Chitinimonas sp. BJB300 TaxID=1559339 RepID=UPI0011124128|nr:cyclic nucleotide-binding and patatin-like phospholipase domain-containing protein [Chitinimonas sp. BJB300]TSJ90951.1 cyclic nucleotide-binding domain-containing protein [Chitinimonas sp. BJB300]
MIDVDPDAALDQVLAILRASRLFGALDTAWLHALAQRLELRHVNAGELVFKESAASDSMIIVLSGRLRVSRYAREGNRLLYNELCPGECVGETGMILQQPRTADVIALRDSMVAELPRAGYEALIMGNPLLFNQLFSQAIYHYLRHTPQLSERRRAQSYVVVPLEEGDEAQVLCAGMAAALGKLGRVRHLQPEALTDGESSADQIARRIGSVDALETQSDYLIYEAQANLGDWTRHAVRHADQVVFVTSHAASPALNDLEHRLRSEPGFSFKRQHIVLLHPKGTIRPSEPIPWREGRELERIYLVRRECEEDFARLGRFLTGRAVGIVLGGGGARGFAHLGVLRALEEAGIPIDLVGGNSMGALIGAQYACGSTLDEILAGTQALAAGGVRFTLPMVSMLSNTRMERDLQTMFGDARIDTLWRPYFAAACNLSRACTAVQDQGPLWRAVMASNSPAGLLPPVLSDGDLLVDGAILDNVPVEAMRMRLGTPLEKRRGNGTIIAVDVDVREHLSVDPSVRRLSAWGKIKSHLSNREAATPGIGDILYRASHMGGLTQRMRTISLADFYLEPPVAEFPLMGYRHASEIVEVAYRYTIAEIAKWDRQSILE